MANCVLIADMDLISQITKPSSKFAETKPLRVDTSLIPPLAPIETNTPPPVTPTTPAMPATAGLPEATIIAEERLLSEPVAPSNGTAPVPPAVGANGEAVVNSADVESGERKKRAYRRRQPDSMSHVPNIADLEAANIAVDYKLMSEATFDLSVGVLSNSLGPEWQPKTPEERQSVCTALETYFKFKQVKDLPPGLALTIVVVAYSAPRLKEPSTSSKLRLAWTWIKVKILRK